MTQLTLNIENMEITSSETIAADIKASYGEVMDHIKGEIDLPLAKDIKF